MCVIRKFVWFFICLFCSYVDERLLSSWLENIIYYSSRVKWGKRKKNYTKEIIANVGTKAALKNCNIVYIQTIYDSKYD